MDLIQFVPSNVEWTVDAGGRGTRLWQGTGSQSAVDILIVSPVELHSIAPTFQKCTLINHAIMKKIMSLL
jgi:hypothetical protein